MENLNKTEITEWRWKIKWLQVIIKKWETINFDKPIFNTYIIIKEKNLWEDFKYINLRSKQISNRYIYNYSTIEHYFEFNSWITFYEKIFNQKWKIEAVKVWNDYNHIWNDWETFESIFEDLKNSIDVFIMFFPNYLVWNRKDWSYEKYDKDNKYHN